MKRLSRYPVKNSKNINSTLRPGIRLLVCIFMICVILGYQSYTMGNYTTLDSTPEITDSKLELRRLYNQIQPIEDRPSYKVFATGMRGYRALLKEGKLHNRNTLTLIDFSLSSTVKRLWVVDLESMRVVHHSLVSHGKNTGNEYAVKFSNVPSSCMSSLGFFVTGKTYIGKHGLSLKLEGIEKDINDNAKRRAIVIHGANYASKKFITTYGRLGRSFGCPALPVSKCKPIIETIKGKSCLFIYYPDEDYFCKSGYVDLEQ